MSQKKKKDSHLSPALIDDFALRGEYSWDQNPPNFQWLLPN